MTTTTITLSPDHHADPSPSPKQALTQSLPALSTLQTWVHRSQAIAKCFVSDVYGLRALVPAELTLSSYASRDVFLLDKFPCKMVELVGWVAGVDHKESSMIITLDDGDGLHVLPVTVRLPFITVVHKVTTTTVESKTPSNFLSAREFKAVRRKADPPPQPPTKAYARKDVRVGDTVRVIGRVDEWQRRKAGGEAEWVRQVVVEEGAGGSVGVVEPEEAYDHATEICRLHQTVYSQPFRMPVSPPLKQKLGSMPSSPVKSMATWSHGMEPSSEAMSEYPLEDDDLKLRDPSKLRPSQLTDWTFRQYLLDYMTQETIRSLRSASAAGPSSTCAALERVFPEYGSSRKGKSKENSALRQSTRDNAPDASTPRTFRLRKPVLPPPSIPDTHIQPFSIPSLLLVPHLAELATLVVDSEARKEERRRRRRIRDGLARPRDLDGERQRRARGDDAKEWRLSEADRWTKMERLVEWVIRNVAEEGSLVQVQLDSGYGKCDGEAYGYLPLPPQLLLPVLIPLLQAEKVARQNTFLRKTDPRRGNGMTVPELVGRLRCWGEEGRWERIGEWKVEEAMEWGEERGLMERVGVGWWAVEGEG